MTIRETVCSLWNLFKKEQRHRYCESGSHSDLIKMSLRVELYERDAMKNLTENHTSLVVLSD